MKCSKAKEINYVNGRGAVCGYAEKEINCVNGRGAVCGYAEKEVEWQGV